VSQPLLGCFRAEADCLVTLICFFLQTLQEGETFELTSGKADLSGHDKQGLLDRNDRSPF
jgi:hypothetical protein